MAFETVFAFFDIRQSLSCENTGNVNGISRRGTNTIEVRSELSANSSMSEMSLHHTELALSTTLAPIKFNSLVLYRLKFTLMHLIPIDISDNTRVFEVYDGIVNEELGGRGGMENVEVIILDPRVVEIWSGMCLHMKGDGVFGVSLLANPYNVSVNPNLPKGDVLCYLILTILIEEDKRVLLHITAVVLTPPSSWVIWVVKLFNELRDIGDGTRCRREGYGGVVLSKSDWLVALNVII